MDSWIKVIYDRMNEINLLAEWAGQVGYGDVRDKLRMASGLLLDKARRRQEILDHAAKVDGEKCPRP